MFGINPGEFAVLLVIALIVVGPERLPKYAAQLGRLVREGRKMAMGLREQVRGELGPEFDDVDWKKLDPRQYDPRKIIRDALTEAIEDDEPAPAPAAKPVSSGGPAAVSGAAAGAGAVGAAAAAGAGTSANGASSPDGAAGAAGATGTSSLPPGAGLPSVSPADKRPSSAASPLEAAAVGKPGGPSTSGGAAAPVNGQADEAADGASVPMARSAAGAPVDLEAT